MTIPTGRARAREIKKAVKQMEAKRKTKIMNSLLDLANITPQLREVNVEVRNGNRELLPIQEKLQNRFDDNVTHLREGGYLSPEYEGIVNELRASTKQAPNEKWRRWFKK